MTRTLLQTSEMAGDPGDSGSSARSWLRNFVVGLTAFLTVVDLFATQAVLPSLAARYGVGPAAIGTAVNACTIGMAASGLLVALFSHQIDRRRGIISSLALLSIPTALLAVAPDLASFTALRIVQGVLMAAAFTLTLAHLGEHLSAAAAASAVAAYITGNVASNLFGRALSAALTDHLGLSENFLVFAFLNLAGAALVHATIARAPAMPDSAMPGAAAMRAGWSAHLHDDRLRAAFAIGFCILFAFIGTFTYVNFVLVRPPYALAPMTLAIVYLVFLPSIATTPLAARAVGRFGTRATLWSSLALAVAGLPLLVLGSLPAMLAGLALVGVGTFFAQATATGFVGRAATHDRGAASGLYLACYFAGGLAGSAVLGTIFDRFGWRACVAGIAISLATAMALATRLRAVPAMTGRHSRNRIARALPWPLAAWIALLIATTPAAAGPREEIRALYERFAAAQNSRDLAAVRDLFLQSPSFLWVSDGMSFWGPDAVIERMATFQEYEIWRVDPDLADSVAVEIGPRAAYLHLPLALTLGQRAPGPATHRFLVSVLGVETENGWRIAALFTTAQKPR